MAFWFQMIPTKNSREKIDVLAFPPKLIASKLKESETVTHSGHIIDAVDPLEIKATLDHLSIRYIVISE